MSGGSITARGPWSQTTTLTTIAGKIPDQSLNGRGATATVDLSGVFGDDDTLTYTVAPAGVGGATLAVSGSALTLATPGDGSPLTATPQGGVTITVTATDSQGDATSTAFALNVYRGHNAPVLEAVEDRTYYITETITPFGFPATDADGDAVTIAVSGLPAGLSYDQSTGQVSGAVSTGSFSDNRVGDYTVTVTATDNDTPAQSAAITFTIAVKVGLSVEAVFIDEGDSGTSVMIFTIRKTGSDFSLTPVRVNWAAEDGTATAGQDYVAASGAVAPFYGLQSTQTVSVTVNGDGDAEIDETLAVVLSDPSDNALIISGSGRAEGLIRNDDGRAIGLGQASVSVDEGDAGTTTVELTVRANPAPTQRTTVDWATASTDDDTATAGEDYVAGSGTLTFAAGDATKTIPITVIGDTDREPSETFTVTLSNLAFADPDTRDAVLQADRTTVQVTVRNDELHPIFSEDSYTFDLAENADGSVTPVAVGTASAAPSVEGNAVMYSITAGNDDGKFAIDSGTGAITYTGSGEDYEAFDDDPGPDSAFTLTVRARDETADTYVTVDHPGHRREPDQRHHCHHGDERRGRGGFGHHDHGDAGRARAGGRGHSSVVRVERQQAGGRAERRPGRHHGLDQRQRRLRRHNCRRVQGGNH